MEKEKMKEKEEKNKNINRNKEVSLKNFDYRFIKGWRKAIGLMFMKKNDKIFIFEKNNESKDIIHSFFCETLYLYFLNKNKEIIEVKRIKPFRIYFPKNKFQYLIESFKDLKLKEGDKIIFDS
ncbi:MAG: hypothetical protein ABGW69_03530 [Nanoarchaeota archaeon]